MGVWNVNLYKCESQSNTLCKLVYHGLHNVPCVCDDVITNLVPRTEVATHTRSYS